jgi:hypothetical protein
MSIEDPGGDLHLDVLVTEIGVLLDSVGGNGNAEAASDLVAKLNRQLLAFMETEVVPQATCAAERGVDPTPLLTVVARVLHVFADALRRPDAEAG